jgi:hypothetical protein
MITIAASSEQTRERKVREAFFESKRDRQVYGPVAGWFMG